MAGIIEPSNVELPAKGKTGMDGKKLSIARARQEAKKRSRTGEIGYLKALEQIAVEQGFEKWVDMRKDREANPLPRRQPDFVVHLTPKGKSEVEVEVRGFMKNVLEFSAIDQAEWDQSTRDEREQLVIEYALGTRHQKGDFADYYAEVVAGLDPDADDPAEPMRES